MQASAVPTSREFLLKYKVKQREDGLFCGLLVKKPYALRFVEGRQCDRKTVEIRSKHVSFLECGERIGLVSTEVGSPRKLLAVLEYEGCIKIMKDSFGSWYSMHRVTAAEFEECQQNWSDRENDHCFGYKFRLVHIFYGRPSVEGAHGAQVWWYFRVPGKRPVLTQEDSDAGCPSAKLAKTVSRASLSDTSCAPSQSQPVKRKLSQAFSAVADSPGPSQACREDRIEVLDFARELDEVEPDDLPKGDCTMCLLLDECEWNSLQIGKANFFLRPFKANVMEFLVLIHSEDSYHQVGNIMVSAFQSAKLYKPSKYRAIYSSSQLNAMKSHKEAWEWHVGEIKYLECHGKIRYIDVPPRGRNRPFLVENSKLGSFADAHAFPREMNLAETGRFFLNQMDEKQVQILESTLRSLDSKTIRIGTTCSGTDICVLVLRETVKMLNESKAWCRSLSIYIYKKV